jgi:hypothetical protein
METVSRCIRNTRRHARTGKCGVTAPPITMLSLRRISRKHLPIKLAQTPESRAIHSFLLVYLIHRSMIVQSETKVYVHIPRTLTTSIVIVRGTINCNIPLPSYDHKSSFPD